MTEAEAQQAVRPLASGVHVGPSEDHSPELSREQQAWLECKAVEEYVTEVGPCRWLPGGALVVEVESWFDRETFVVSRDGEEL